MTGPIEFFACNIQIVLSPRATFASFSISGLMTKYFFFFFFSIRFNFPITTLKITDSLSQTKNQSVSFVYRSKTSLVPER